MAEIFQRKTLKLATTVYWFLYGSGSDLVVYLASKTEHADDETAADPAPSGKC